MPVNRLKSSSDVRKVLRPSLVQIKTAWGGIAALKGVRANCHVEIYKDGTLFNQSTGELQLTEMGISGPVVFEISRDVCYGSGEWTAKLDFLPEWTEEQLADEIEKRIVEKHMYVKSGDKIESFMGANAAIGVLILKYESREIMNRIVDNFNALYEIELE